MAGIVRMVTNANMIKISRILIGNAEIARILRKAKVVINLFELAKTVILKQQDF